MQGNLNLENLAFQPNLNQTSIGSHIRESNRGMFLRLRSQSLIGSVRCYNSLQVYQTATSIASIA